MSCSPTLHSGNQRQNQENSMKLCQSRFRLDREKALHPKGGWPLEQAPQGSDHGPKPARAQEHLTLSGTCTGPGIELLLSLCVPSNSVYSVILCSTIIRVFEFEDRDYSLPPYQFYFAQQVGRARNCYQISEIFLI